MNRDRKKGNNAMNRLVVQTAAIAALTMVGANVHAADLHVPAAFPTIQAAIDAAVAGDRVVVADGVYSGRGNVDLTLAGKEITVMSANGAATCTIDCAATPTSPARAFALVNGETENTIIDGFTITNGATPPGAVNDLFNGAAILCNASSPVIRNCVFANNHAGCWGGAICATNASPRIESSHFHGNQVDDDGGAVFGWLESHIVMVNCVVRNNHAVIVGGAVTSFGGSITILNSTLIDNEAGWGPGIYNSSQLTIRNSIVRGNVGTSNSDQIIGGSFDIVEHCNVQGGFAGTGNIDLDPNFADGYRLTHGSPCIDAGMTLLELPAHDIDGDVRVAGLSVDIGADEAMPIGDVDRDGLVNVLDVLGVLAAWGPCGGSDCHADVNGDNAVNVLDLLAVLAGWGG